MLINIVTTVLPLIIQVPMAVDYCEKYMDEQLMPNLMSRRNIAFLYLAYMEEQKNATTNIASSGSEDSDITS